MDSPQNTLAVSALVKPKGKFQGLADCLDFKLFLTLQIFAVESWKI